jgi:hypothetical protein
VVAVEMAGGCAPVRHRGCVIARGCLPWRVPAGSEDCTRRAQAPVRHRLTTRLAVAFSVRSVPSLIPVLHAYVPVVAPGADVTTAHAPR